MALFDAFSVTAGVLLTCVCIIVVYTSNLPPHKKGFLRRKNYAMPPGPRGSPLLGSLLDWLHARNNGTMVPWVR
jgi:hypothetical protein